MGIATFQEKNFYCLGPKKVQKGPKCPRPHTAKGLFTGYGIFNSCIKDKRMMFVLVRILLLMGPNMTLFKRKEVHNNKLLHWQKLAEKNWSQPVTKWFHCIESSYCEYLVRLSNLLFSFFPLVRLRNISGRWQLAINIYNCYIVIYNCNYQEGNTGLKFF